MRSYAPYDKLKLNQAKPPPTKKERRERTSDEWDIRIDCDADYADDIVENIKKAKHLLHYALVSGREQPDSAQYGSKDIHVHIALVLEYACRRDQVLAICRGHTKKTDEYATPRNRKFTYAGWYLHHTKLDWKLVLEPDTRLELGILPKDPVTEESKKEVQRMIKKFATADSAQHALALIKFAEYVTPQDAEA